MQLAVSRTQSA